MPEGDTIFRAARTLNRALAGSLVTRFESTFPGLTRVDEDRPIRGRTIEAVRARGKHLLITFSGDLILRTHMRMNGSWHIYRPGERWGRPRHDMRLLIETEKFVVVGFNVPVAEFLTPRALSRHAELAALGPDPLAPAFDGADVVRRMRAHRDAPIAGVLLNQRVIAGLGNVLKSETLFVAKVDPFAPVASLPDGVLERLVNVARDLLVANTLEPARSLTATSGRRTTRRMDPSAKLWVYARAGQPCRRCGTPIAIRRAAGDARPTYWCPQCQRSAPS